MSAEPKIVFYTHPVSRGRIARWMLEEVGEPYETRFLDFATTMKAPEYLQINPMGKVPAIVHEGRVVTEYSAICAYLADAFPEAGLAPAERSAYYRWLFFGAGPLEGGIVLTALGAQIPDERRGMVGFRDVPTMVAALDHWLSSHPYLAGDAFSAADVATGSQIGWGLRFGSIQPTPALQDYWDRISSRPAARAAQEQDDRAAAEAAAARTTTGEDG